MQEKIRQYLKQRNKTMSFFGRNQYHDWMILVCFSFVGFVAAIIIGFLFYYEMGQGNIFDGDVVYVPHTNTVDKQTLTNMIDKIELKTKNFESVKNLNVKISDPSL